MFYKNLFSFKRETTLFQFSFRKLDVISYHQLKLWSFFRGFEYNK